MLEPLSEFTLVPVPAVHAVASERVVVPDPPTILVKVPDVRLNVYDDVVWEYPAKLIQAISSNK